MDPATLQSTLTHALQQTERYVWLYIEGPTLLLPEAQRGADAPWVRAIRQGRGEALRKPR